MNPYSHVVVASKLDALVDPENTQEYYWGAIAPDIRYLAAVPRYQTHIPSERIIDFVSQYPQLKSFLQGYLVHCLCDEIDLGQVFFQHFPFSILKKKMSRQQMAVILELYYFETERIDKNWSGAHNEVLSELGLSEAQSAKLSQSISQYATSSSFESRVIDLSRLLGLDNDSRIDKYMAAALREAREETGTPSRLHAPLEKIEYWYYGQNRGQRVRFHKVVHFFLFEFESGNTTDHDNEVEEARWVEIGQAQKLLAFKNEQKVVNRALTMLQGELA